MSGVTEDDDVGAAPTIESTASDADGHLPTTPGTIGRYRVLRWVGAGGMGVVFAAHDPELGRDVAVKVVHGRSGLRREAQALAKLTHPNVVSVHDVGCDGDVVYIVMQLVDGATIDEWIRARALDQTAIVALYVQAGRGLAAAPDAGLVHRDFKPSNVLVDRDGTVRVTDFGLARGEGGDGEVSGTPAYMAPEQFALEPISAATDQFGFCVSLWEALTGARPFPGEGVDT